MRTSIVMLTILAIHSTFAPTYAAQGPFPYVAYVAAENAPLRSGPGEDYYETSHVEHGQSVEVWRHAPGGWLAVRPPQGSFSLVSAADVRVRPDRVAEVVRADVPAQIGSQASEDRDVVQVLLAQGEEVHVLETITLGGGFWHKIAPPAGEFRWIHEAHVAGPTVTPHDSPVAQDASRREPVASSPKEIMAAGGEDRTPRARRSGETPDLHKEVVDAVGDGHTYRVARYSPAAGDSLSAEVQPDAVTAEAADQADPAVTLADIELELATIVAEDSRLWRFAHLRRRCDELLQSSASSRQEGIEAVLEKIARFERIRDRSESLARRREEFVSANPAQTPEFRGVADRVDRDAPETHERVAVRDEDDARWRASRAEARPADVQSPRSEPVESGVEVVRIPDHPVESAADAGRYDGVGTLRPVVSRRREAPRYALVDAEGDMTMFITPSPGVNLQPYIGQHIGVVGTRGYMPEFKRPHVTAARVTPLR